MLLTWRGWWPQVADGELLDVLDLAAGAFGDDVGRVVLVERVEVEGQGAAPAVRLVAVQPEAPLAERLHLLGRLDLQRLVRAQQRLLHRAQHASAAAAAAAAAAARARVRGKAGGRFGAAEGVGARRA